MVFEKQAAKEEPKPAPVVVEKPPLVDSDRVEFVLKQHEEQFNQQLAGRELEIEKNNQMMVAQQQMLEELMRA